MKIVFFGTAGFAVPALKALNESQHDVVAVVTGVDRRGGRGRKEILISPVKKYAVEQQLKLLQPPNLKSEAFQSELQSLQADAFAVVAFRMLPEGVWGMPERGTVNLHASLLPAYRGAAPINHAIIQGEKKTGLSVFLLKKEIDTGDILCSEKVTIGPDETAGELHDRMALIGAELLENCISRWERGELDPVPQDHRQASSAPKIFKEFCLLDFSLDTDSVYNKIRGLSPYPGAYTPFGDKELKIFRATTEKAGDHVSAKTGIIKSDGKNYLKIKTADGWIDCKEVQLQGKRKMDVEEFLNGMGDKLPAFAG